MTESIDKLKEALKGTDIGAIKTAVEKLTEKSQAMGQAIYAAAQAEGEQSAPSGDASGGDDDVVDAEVVDEPESGGAQADGEPDAPRGAGDEQRLALQTLAKRKRLASSNVILNPKGDYGLQTIGLSGFDEPSN